MMLSERKLCQILLNGPVGGGVSAAAEEWLRPHLAQPDHQPSDFGAGWKAAAIPQPADESERRRILRCLAPAMLLDCVWLARVAQPSTAHRAAENRLFELYCRRVGLNDPAQGTARRRRAALWLAGIHLPECGSPAFFLDPGLPDFALLLPCAHLALLHRPRSFFPELLGYTLAHVCRQPEWWDLAVPVEAADAPVRAVLEDYPERAARIRRIWAGWDGYQRLFDRLLRESAEEARRKTSAEQAMAELVAARRGYAQGYHRRVLLVGRSLDSWLAESATDPRPLLRALHASPWVDQACPEGSRLLRAMEFGGPMFGVFDEEERRVCREWIGAPDGNEEQVSPRPRTAWVCGFAAPAHGACLRRRQNPAFPRLADSRGGFLALLRAESPADVSEFAAAVVEGILFRTRVWSLAWPRHKRFFPYDPQGFHGYVEALHRHEVERYRPLAGLPRLSREFCRWAALQLAPAILVDGCWLASIPTAEENLGESGRHLLRIYADELGNGHPGWNHPNVYRRLLESLGFELPPFDSDAFAAHPGFLDAAFSIPSYLLAIGWRTDRYFPEVLGLNLAIELSGLGAGYMSMADMLEYHGIDPTILRLHLSIDNLATGHAARAREAIVLYLDEVRRREGEGGVDPQWRRIWRGYRSLDTAACPLVFGLLLRYGLRERINFPSCIPGLFGR